MKEGNIGRRGKEKGKGEGEKQEREERREMVKERNIRKREKEKGKGEGEEHRKERKGKGEKVPYCLLLLPSPCFLLSFLPLVGKHPQLPRDNKTGRDKEFAFFVFFSLLG